MTTKCQCHRKSKVASNMGLVLFMGGQWVSTLNGPNAMCQGRCRGQKRWTLHCVRLSTCKSPEAQKRCGFGMKKNLKKERMAWVGACLEELTGPVPKLHGPLIECLIDVSGCPQTDLPDFCHTGFSYVGIMPEYKLDSVEKTKTAWSVTPDDLWNSRPETNQKIPSSLWESDYDDEIRKKIQQDADDGFQKKPQWKGVQRCA